jgi:hypothetical protein
MRIKNIEAEDFLNPHSDLIKRLERSIHETFRGKGVNPYIFVRIKVFACLKSQFRAYIQNLCPITIKSFSCIIGPKLSLALLFR